MKTQKISTAVLYGLIAGALLIGLTFGTYEGGVQVFMSPVIFAGYALLIGLAIAAALMEKRRGGGYLEFQGAVKASFTVSVIGMAIHTLFYWFLLNVIDTQFRENVAKLTMLRQQDAMRRMGWTEEDIQRNVANVKSSELFSLGHTLTALCMIYIVLFLVSLLIAAMVRRKKQPDQAAGA